MSLADRIDSFPQAWKPKAGDKLVGSVSELGERESEYHQTPYPIGFHTVAKNELAKQRPSVGDRIGIKYFGKDEELGYERYRIVVEKAEPASAEPDWGAMAEETGQELQTAPSDPKRWAEQIEG
jgi:hypothetical protein